MKHMRRSRYDERKGEPRIMTGTSMSIIQEPLAVEIDPTSQGFKQNPFPTLTKMRELGAGDPRWFPALRQGLDGDDLRRGQRPAALTITGSCKVRPRPATAGRGLSSAGRPGASSRWPRTCCSAIRPTIAGSVRRSPAGPSKMMGSTSLMPSSLAHALLRHELARGVRAVPHAKAAEERVGACVACRSPGAAF